MAPRRGGSGGGGSGAEETMTIDKVEGSYRTPLGQAFGIDVAVVIFMLMLFILSNISRIRWRHLPGTRAFTMTIFFALFNGIAFFLHGSILLSYLRGGRVPESFVLTSFFSALFICVAELLLVAAFVYIIHNRLRAVGITTVAFPILNWVLYVLLAILNLLVSAGYMAYHALDLADLKSVEIYPGPKAWDYASSKFYDRDLPRTNAAMRILYMFFVMWLVILAVVVGTMSLQSRSHGGRRSIFIYIFAVLLPAFITYLYYAAMTIRWDLLLDEGEEIPGYLLPLESGMRGLVLGVAGYGILAIAFAANREHWAAGVRSTVRYNAPPAAMTQYP
ncbi:hypothetical protein BDZ91DRAFT_762239 [Kalaharituber pfeilii]|nr:hypothetical protein BDZ91DRAFT_762239 [Kalaharituber pfeilii]